MSEFLVNLLGERLVNGEKAEVDVHSLGSKLSLLGLYFGCSLNGPCKQFNASLCEFYSKFKKSSEHKDKLEIVFISSDQDQKQWQDFLQEMQWPALPFKDRHKKVRWVSGFNKWHKTGNDFNYIIVFVFLKNNKQTKSVCVCVCAGVKDKEVWSNVLNPLTFHCKMINELHLYILLNSWELIKLAF